MSSHNLRTVRRVALPLIVCALAFGTASCSSEESAMSDGFVKIEHSVNDPDPIRIEIPDGWVDNGATYSDDPMVELTLTRTLGLTGLMPGLFAVRTSPHYLTNADDGDPLTVNIWTYRDNSLKEGASIEGVSNRVPLPDRTIDGLPAPGEQHVYTDEDGTTTIVQAWYVLRRDGIWKIGVRSEANSPDVPQELFDAINTIHWTPSGEGTGTE